MTCRLINASSFSAGSRCISMSESSVSAWIDRRPHRVDQLKHRVLARGDDDFFDIGNPNRLTNRNITAQPLQRVGELSQIGADFFGQSGCRPRLKIDLEPARFGFDKPRKLLVGQRVQLEQKTMLLNRLKSAVADRLFRRGTSGRFPALAIRRICQAASFRRQTARQASRTSTSRFWPSSAAFWRTRGFFAAPALAKAGRSWKSFRRWRARRFDRFDRSIDQKALFAGQNTSGGGALASAERSGASGSSDAVDGAMAGDYR